MAEQDAYVFLRSTDDPEKAVSPPANIQSIPFSLAAGAYAKLIVLKGDDLESVSSFLQEISGVDVNKALAAAPGSPYRIVHMGSFLYMAFVQVWITAGGDPRVVLERISHMQTFKGGAVVQGTYDILVEFGDDADSGQVRNDAVNVITVGGVSRREISTAFNP